jgi:hypothetical protein
MAEEVGYISTDIWSIVAVVVVAVIIVMLIKVLKERI